MTESPRFQREDTQPIWSPVVVAPWIPTLRRAYQKQRGFLCLLGFRSVSPGPAVTASVQPSGRLSHFGESVSFVFVASCSHSRSLWSPELAAGPALSPVGLTFWKAACGPLTCLDPASPSRAHLGGGRRRSWPSFAAQALMAGASLQAAVRARSTGLRRCQHPQGNELGRCLLVFSTETPQ